MLALLLLLAVFVESTTWYATSGVGEKEAEYLKEKKCFRGTYRDVSLLTCETQGAQFIADLPDHTPLCFLDLDPLSDGKRAAEIATQSGEVTVIYSGKGSLILAAKDLATELYPSACFDLEAYSGSVWNMIPIPSTPILPLVHIQSPVAAPNPKIQALLDLVTADNLRSTDTALSNFWTRQAQSNSNNSGTGSDGRANTNFLDAVAYAGQIFAAAGFQVVNQSINRTGYGPNVAAIKRGTVRPNQWTVVGAHLDSRGPTLASTSNRAPGADDNGSGSTAVLELAKLIARQSLTFQGTLLLTLFSGEEQGLYGSDWQAKQFRAGITPLGPDSSASVVAMFNVDMLGYNDTNPRNPLAFMSGSASASETNLCIANIREYANFATNTTFPIGTTSACCSDQQSFNSQGIPAVGFFETPTARVTYPHYHQATDLPQYLDFNQMVKFSQAMYICALTKVGVN